jgi:hypothetical protein
MERHDKSMGAAVPWIMLASVIVACFSAVFSRRSSQIAAQSSQISADASQATLYLKFQEEYAKDEMAEDLNKLREWRETYGLDFANKWGEQYELKTKEALEVYKARRHVSHFFGAVADLYNNGYLSERLARRVVNFTGIALLFEVVEPLEEQLGKQFVGKPYDKAPFDILRKLSGR